MTLNLTEPVLRKLVEKATERFETKRAANLVKIATMRERDAAFPQEKALKQAAVDLVNGRVGAFDDLATNGLITEGQKIDDAEYKRLVAERDAKTAALHAWMQSETAAITALQNEINDVDLPAERDLKGRVQQYEEMLAALLEVNASPSATGPAETATSKVP